MDVSKTIKKQLKGVIGRKEFRSMTPESRFREDLGMDSIKMVLTLNNLCTDLDIDILTLDPNEVMELSTVGALEKFLSKEKTKNI